MRSVELVQRLLLKNGSEGRKVSKADWFFAKKPATTAKKCGDVGLIKQFKDKVFLAIVDVLGHDSENAYQVAESIRTFLDQHYGEDLKGVMNSLHEHIRGTRGAVVGLCLMDLKRGELRFVGVGDISAKKFGTVYTKCISRGGVVGYQIPSLKEEELELSDGDVLILHTDGVRDHFSLKDYPELLNDDVKTVAKRIVEWFGRGYDDAACIAVRYQS